MGYRERRIAMIAKRAAPHLEPGEQIQTGFVAQSGRGLVSAPVSTFVVTDRAILVVQRSGARRFPREFRFGAPTGVYHTFELDRPYKVHRQYYPEITSADKALDAMRRDGAS